MLDYQAIGRRLRVTRKRQGLTQVALGEAVGLSASFIGHIERGNRKASIETIYVIAKALNASLDMLITGAISVEEECISFARKKQILDAILHILDAHSDEWMPPLKQVYRD